MDDAPTLTLADAGALVGGYRWMEHRLFQITGSWAATCADPATRIHLLESSLQHAWHAGLWADRLPVLDHVDPEALTVPSGPAARPLFDAVWALAAHESPAGGAGSPASDVRRLAALYRVTLPRLVAGYSHHLAMASPVAEAPTIRALRLVLRDETESWQAGEAILQALLTRPELVAAAAETQRALETIVVEAGIGTGIVPWPDGGGAAARGAPVGGAPVR